MLVCNLPPHSMSDKKTMTEANLRLVRMGEIDLNVLIFFFNTLVSEMLLKDAQKSLEAV